MFFDIYMCLLAVIFHCPPQKIFDIDLMYCIV